MKASTLVLLNEFFFRSPCVHMFTFFSVQGYSSVASGGAPSLTQYVGPFCNLVLPLLLLLIGTVQASLCRYFNNIRICPVHEDYCRFPCCANLTPKRKEPNVHWGCKDCVGHCLFLLREVKSKHLLTRFLWRGLLFLVSPFLLSGVVPHSIRWLQGMTDSFFYWAHGAFIAQAFAEA